MLDSMYHITLKLFWNTCTVEVNAGLLLRVCTRKIIFLFLNQNICWRYSKEPSRWDSSFERPIYMLKIIGKKILTILHWNFFLYLNLWLNACQTVSVSKISVCRSSECWDKTAQTGQSLPWSPYAICTIFLWAHSFVILYLYVPVNCCIFYLLVLLIIVTDQINVCSNPSSFIN